MDFGRQPEKVTVTLSGDMRDVVYWQTELSRRAQFKGDNIVRVRDGEFIIYPLAVND